MMGHIFFKFVLQQYSHVNRSTESSAEANMWVEQFETDKSVGYYPKIQ